MTLQKKLNYNIYNSLSNNFHNKNYCMIINFYFTNTQETKKFYALCGEKNIFIKQLKLNLLKNRILDKHFNLFLNGPTYILFFDNYDINFHQLLKKNKKIQVQILLYKNKFLNYNYFKNTMNTLTPAFSQINLMKLFTVSLFQKNIFMLNYSLIQFLSFLKYLCQR